MAGIFTKVIKKIIHIIHNAVYAAFVGLHNILTKKEA